MELPRLGYKQDLPDGRDYLAESLIGKAAQDVVVPASIMRFRKGVLVQGGAGSCVANALARAIDVCLRVELAQAGSLIEPPKASRRFMYFNARQQEVVDALADGDKPEPITDGGCYPRLAMRAVQKLGFCPEDVFPYTDRQQRPGESAEGTINQKPPPAASQQAFDQKDFKYARVTRTRLGRVVDVARALKRDKPVIIGMYVDKPFMRWDGSSVITSVDKSDPDGGGHMLAVVEVTADRVILDNWWGEDWGANGLVHLSHDLFGSAIVSDTYILETAPFFSGRMGAP
jgi:hypothetical protein